jgi:RHS repeat-associated protein
MLSYRVSQLTSSPHKPKCSPNSFSQGLYLAYDQVGSLRAIANAEGNVVKRIDYDSFGNIIADTNPLFDIPFGFASGLLDRDTGFIGYGSRDYDPDTGRWTAKDPILFAGGMSAFMDPV